MCTFAFGNKNIYNNFIYKHKNYYYDEKKTSFSDGSCRRNLVHW